MNFPQSLDCKTFAGWFDVSKRKEKEKKDIHLGHSEHKVRVHVEEELL